EASNQVSVPAARIASPPMPTKCAFGQRRRSCSTSPAPSRSPEASPATSAMRIGRVRTGSSGKSTASAQQRALAGVDEIEQGADVWTFARHVGQLHPGLVERATRDVERAVGALDGADAVGVEPAALEPFAVDPAR